MRHGQQHLCMAGLVWAAGGMLQSGYGTFSCLSAKVDACSRCQDACNSQMRCQKERQREHHCKHTPYACSGAYCRTDTSCNRDRGCNARFMITVSM